MDNAGFCMVIAMPAIVILWKNNRSFYTTQTEIQWIIKFSKT